MWTTDNRPRYSRDKRRYSSDLADEEWTLIAPLIPQAKPGGRRPSVDVRTVANDLLSVLSTGCQWFYVPKDLLPKSTLYDYINLWTYLCVIDRLYHALQVKCRDGLTG